MSNIFLKVNISAKGNCVTALIVFLKSGRNVES